MLNICREEKKREIQEYTNTESNNLSLSLRQFLFRVEHDQVLFKVSTQQ